MDCCCTGNPLFSCVDEVVLLDEMNEIVVNCRIVSVHASLSSVKVRVFNGPVKNFTLQPEVHSSRPSEETYQANHHYVAKVVPELPPHLGTPTVYVAVYYIVWSCECVMPFVIWSFTMSQETRQQAGGRPRSPLRSVTVELHVRWLSMAPPDLEGTFGI